MCISCVNKLILKCDFFVRIKQLIKYFKLNEWKILIFKKVNAIIHVVSFRMLPTADIDYYDKYWMVSLFNKAIKGIFFIKRASYCRCTVSFNNGHIKCQIIFEIKILKVYW